VEDDVRVCHEGLEQRAVLYRADVHGEARMLHQAGEVLQPTGRQIIQDRDVVALLNEKLRQMRADEAGSARDDCAKTVVMHS
jgi:hypothetical protein